MDLRTRWQWPRKTVYSPSPENRQSLSSDDWSFLLEGGTSCIKVVIMSVAFPSVVKAVAHFVNIYDLW